MASKRTKPKLTNSRSPRPRATKRGGVRVFVSYSHKDDGLRSKFAEQLQILVNLGVIRPWYDRMIEVGKEWERQILRQLSSSHIILLLVSPSLCASEYAYGVEVQRAMALHRRGKARVLPIVLRPTPLLEHLPFGKLQLLPTDGRPVTRWGNRDEAFASIAKSLFDVASTMR